MCPFINLTFQLVNLVPSYSDLRHYHHDATQDPRSQSVIYLIA